MKVIVPYTAITQQEVVDATNKYAPQAEQVYVGDSAHAYYNLLERLWRENEAFVLIEHDIEIHKTVMSEFEECKELWCGFTYALSGHGFAVAFGCTRFSAKLLQECPGVMHKVGAIDDDGAPVRDWRRLDTRTSRVLRDDYGIEQHAHFPPVRHWNKKQNYGVSRDEWPGVVIDCD